MADYGSFKYGAVKYPLPLSGAGLGGAGASLLRDCDPALFYLLEFYKNLLEIHIGDRLLAEAVAAGVNEVQEVVAETLPLNPAPFLTEAHIRFPLLAAYRNSSKPEWIGRTKHSVDEVEVVYVLPPMQAGHAERLLPILKAVHSVFDNRTEQGFDPEYTPTTPAGTAGESWWKRAGVTSAGVMGASFGGFALTDALFFPAITLKVEIKERSDFALDTYDSFDGADVNIDINPPPESVVADVVQFEV